MSGSFDLIVLGAGSGGLAAAQRAAALGARVLLLDPAPPGGTCVHRGCVPKKAIWLAGELADGLGQAARLGFAVTGGALDWGHFSALRQDYIDGITDRYRQRLQAAGITCVARSARLAAAGEVTDTAGERWRAPHVLIATGSRPRRLDVRGFALGWVSDDMFALERLPQRVAVVGGGYIATEFACLLRGLGCEVDLLVRDRLLAGFDAELVEALAEQMTSAGVRIHRPVTVTGLRQAGTTLTLDGNASMPTAHYDGVLWAVGRVPNSEQLGLEALGVRCDGAGHVCVDARQDTTVAGVHAVGDVTDKRALTPVAVAAGRRLAERLFGGDSSARVDYRDIPSVVFARPPLATVGLSEAQAHERHGAAVRVHRSRFRGMLASLAGSAAESLMKIVCVGEEERVVGFHALGPGADELMQGFAVALKLGVCRADLQRTLAIHPSAAEEMLLAP